MKYELDKEIFKTLTLKQRFWAIVGLVKFNLFY